MNNKFKKIYELVEKRQLRDYKKEYTELLSFNNEIGSFEDYVAKLKDDRQDSYIKNNHYKDAVLFKDVMEKESFSDEKFFHRAENYFLHTQLR